MLSPMSKAYSDVYPTSQTGARVPITNSYSNNRQKNTINYFVIPNLIVHIVGLAALFTLWYYLRFTTVFPYHHRVFHCEDIFLYKPNFNPEDFEIYVSYWLLYVLAFLIPPIVICIGEVMFWLFSTKPRKIIYATCRECKIYLITRRLIRFLSVFFFGALITQIFVDVIKLLTGYQRPYFLSLCNVSLPACTAPLRHSPSPSPHLACLYKNADELRYAWLSFPSLHAAFSCYSACFASCYIYYMINWRGAPLLRPMLITTFFAMALVDSFSRINGYKNHWRDIWVGWLIGFSLAFFLCFSVFCFHEADQKNLRPIKLQAESITPSPVETLPFFSWFRLPRVQAPSVKEEYIIYEEDVLPSQISASENIEQNEKKKEKVYEKTTTNESFHRTFAQPPNNNYNNPIKQQTVSYHNY